MSGPRRKKGRRKGAKALGDFIEARLGELEAIAYQLNGSEGWEPTPNDPEPEETRQIIRARYDLADDAAAVVNATLGVRYPEVPVAAGDLFNRLADSAPVHYVVTRWPWHDRPKDEKYFFSVGGGYVNLVTKTARGAWVIDLARFLANPQRDRLRRCLKCRRWFVDETRNKSARRCSRKCTIAWSNAQRATTGTRKRGSR
jgi:hypothetical protein